MSASASSSSSAAAHYYDKVAIVTGATGNVAPHIIQELREKGFHVIACSRREHEPGPDNVTWLTTSGDNISRKEFWDNVLDNYAHNALNVLVVSTIGTARARGDITLEEVNRRMVIPITEAAADFAEDHKNVHVTATHISSLAAQIIPDDEYGRVKRSVDEEIVEIGEHGPENFHSVVFQPGYIFPGAQQTEEGVYHIDDGHPWSMGQIVQLGAAPGYVPYFGSRTICPIAGSGDQIQQPVSITNLAQAIVNASKPEQTDSEIVVAVGPDALTQADMVDFYADMSGREVVHISVPAKIIAAATHHFGYGRLEDFSAKMMDRLDEDNHAFPIAPFLRYLEDDQPHIRMQDVYPDRGDPNVHEITMRPPPIGDHFTRVGGIIRDNPVSVLHCTRDLATSTLDSFPVLRGTLFVGLLAAGFLGIGAIAHRQAHD